MRTDISFFFVFSLNLLLLVSTLKTFYIVTERPTITHVNLRYLSYANFSSVRINRRSPIYYVDLHKQTEVPFDNNIQVDFYFYQFLSNKYKRGFVEMHFKFCRLIHKDPFFGAAMKQGKFAQQCPYPPSDYHMYNMTVPPAAIPPGFPFEKGRNFANLTHKGVDVAGGYIDMELKEKRRRDQI